MPTVVRERTRNGQTRNLKINNRKVVSAEKTTKSLPATEKTLCDNTNTRANSQSRKATSSNCLKNQCSTSVDDPLTLNRQLIELVGSNLQSMDGLNGASFLGSSYDCTELFDELYSLKQTADTTILSLHVKYALKVFDTTNDTELSLKCLFDIYKRLPIEKNTINPRICDLLVINLTRSRNVLLARIITALQTIILKMLSQSDSKLLEVDSVKLAETFDHKVPGSVLYWCEYLPISEKDTRLCTISKFAYGLSTKYSSISTELLILSSQIWQFQANCKRLKAVITKTSAAKFVSAYHRYMVDTLRHIQDSQDRPLTGVTTSLVDCYYKLLENSSHASSLPSRNHFACNSLDSNEKITDVYRRKAIVSFKTAIGTGNSEGKEINSIIIRSRDSDIHAYELGLIVQDFVRKTDRLTEDHYRIIQLFIENLEPENSEIECLSLSSILANNAAINDREDEYYIQIMGLSIQVDRLIFRNSKNLLHSALTDINNRSFSLIGRCIKREISTVSDNLLFACEVMNKLLSLDKQKSPEIALQNKHYEKLITLIAQYSMNFDIEFVSLLDKIELSDTARCFIFESVLCLLRKSRNAKKRQLSKFLVDSVFKTIEFRDQPIICSRTLVYYYYSNGRMLSDYITKLIDLKEILMKKNDSKNSSWQHMLLACLNIIICAINGTTAPKKLSTTTDVISSSIQNHLSIADNKLSFVFLRLIDMYNGILGSSACYAFQCKILNIVTQAEDTPYGCILDLAEAEVNCGKSRSARAALKKCSDHSLFPGRFKSEIELARFLLIKADISLLECDADESRSNLIELLDYLKKSNLITSGEAIRNANESLISLHPKAILFFNSIIICCQFALLTESTTTAISMGNSLIKFITAYMKGIKVQESGTYDLDLRSTVACLIKIAAVTAQAYEKMGLVASSNSRLKLSLKLEDSEEDHHPLIAYRWGGPLYAESNYRQEQDEEAEKIVQQLSEVYNDDIPAEPDMAFYERIYTYLIADQYHPNDETHCPTAPKIVENWLQPRDLAGELNELSLSDDQERGLMRAQARAALAYSNSVPKLGTADNSSTNTEMFTEKFFNDAIYCPENVQLQIFRIRQKYESAIEHLNSNPRYTGIDSDLVLAIPFASNSLKRDLNAIKLISDADSLLRNLHMLVLSKCSYTEIEECSKLATDIMFVHNAISKGHVDSNYPFLMQDVSRDLPYSIGTGGGSAKENAGDIKTLSREDILKSSDIVLESIRSANAFDSKKLPKNWVVISMAYQKNSQALVVTRYENEKKPFSLRLPKYINRDHDYDEDRFTLKEGLDMLRTIVEDANAKIDKPVEEITQQDKEEWWMAKYDGEVKLSQLLKSAAYTWFGGFKALFGSSHVEVTEDFEKKFNEILAKYLPSRQKKKGGSRKANSTLVDIDKSIYRLFSMAGTVSTTFDNEGPNEENEDDLLMEDLVRFLLDMLLSQGEENPYDELDIDQMIVEFEELVQTVERPHIQEHMILVIDNICHEFPWESLPFMIEKEITRVPSLGVLQRMLDNIPDCQWPIENAFYMVDPGNDLKNTQRRISQGINEFQARKEPIKWTGMIGEIPTEEYIMHQIQNKCDVYMYMGHGGGQEYIRRTAIEGISKCPPTMLFGCRSNDLKRQGEYESTGNHLSYLSAGCPMLLCTLFTVTDKDTDHHTMRILEDWLNTSKDSRTITACLARSRQKMKLPYLNGAAFVVYGLPLRAKIT